MAFAEEGVNIENAYGLWGTSKNFNFWKFSYSNGGNCICVIRYIKKLAIFSEASLETQPEFSEMPFSPI
jgi:hypothetical protein